MKREDKPQAGALSMELDPLETIKGGRDLRREAMHEHLGHDHEQMRPIPLRSKVLRVPKSAGHYLQKIDKIIRVTAAQDVLFTILNMIIEKAVKLPFLIVLFD